MNKTILLFSRDPGGCNVIAPLFNDLNKKYKVKLYGKDVALNKYREYGLEGQDIMDSIDNITLEEIEKFLIKERPDFIITGTSADDFVEKFLWKVSEKLKIPSFAILDQWVNYGVRFSEFGVSQLKDYKKIKNHPYLPHRILVMDEYAKDKLMIEGIDEEKILVSGSPYFDYLKCRKEQITRKYIEDFRSNIIGCKNGETLITFVSEPITKTYEENDTSEYYLGYTEKTIFKEFINVLNDFTSEFKKKVKLIVRLHPKDEEDNYNDLIDLVDKEYITTLIDNKLYGLDLIYASDLICGMSSMFLLESVIFKKPIISIQIGLLGENPFVLHEKGIINSVFCEKDLRLNLQNILIQNTYKVNALDIETDSIKNVIMFMEEIL